MIWRLRFAQRFARAAVADKMELIWLEGELG